MCDVQAIVLPDLQSQISPQNFQNVTNNAQPTQPKQASPIFP